MTTEPYRLTARSSADAARAGLVDADWYRSDVAPATMHELTRRRNGRAAVDAVTWIALLVVTGTSAALLFPSPWSIPVFAVYGALYGGASDARWHEYGHGTAFKTSWPNAVLYSLASFMLLREPTVSRWTHVRHHSDTIVVGRDPEILLRRPPKLGVWALDLANLVNGPATLARLVRHAGGWLSDEERTFLPDHTRPAVARDARGYLAIVGAVVAACVVSRSLLPALLVGLPTFYGAWLVHAFNVTQHAGLPENVLDHRVVARTFRLNPIGRFLYLNMNFHIEHHMFPNVPYHQLPRLHDAVRDDLPEPNPSLLAAYRELVPAVLRQRRDPDYELTRPIPGWTANVGDTAAVSTREAVSTGGRIEVCAVDDALPGSVHGIDFDGRAYAVYRLDDGRWFATDGICTHSRIVRLATGTVVGTEVECPKHNGRFDITTGEPTRAPVCQALATYPVTVAGGVVFLDVGSPPRS